MRVRDLLRPAALVAVASVVIASATLIAEGGISVRSPRGYRRLQPARTGDEILAVFLINESCPAAKSDDFRRHLRAALNALRDSVNSHGVRISFIGVSLTENTPEAQQFISAFGSFDESIVGRGWLSSGAVSYVWRDQPGYASVPQLVLVRRRIEVTPGGIAVTPDSVLFRLTGAEDIIRWSEAGVPIGL